MRSGRPREFDADIALDRAMRVFWKKGFEGASLCDLTEAMGVNRPSLYAAFGNKQALFRKVIDRYGQRPGDCDPLAKGTAREVAVAVLAGVVDQLSCAKNPRGCLLIQGALACGSRAEPLRRELIIRRRNQESRLRKRFEQATTTGDLPIGSGPAQLAKFISTLCAGLAIQAANGATRAQLIEVTTLAMRVWPMKK